MAAPVAGSLKSTARQPLDDNYLVNTEGNLETGLTYDTQLKATKDTQRLYFRKSGTWIEIPFTGGGATIPDGKYAELAKPNNFSAIQSVQEDTTQPIYSSLSSQSLRFRMPNQGPDGGDFIAGIGYNINDFDQSQLGFDGKLYFRTEKLSKVAQATLDADTETFDLRTNLKHVKVPEGIAAGDAASFYPILTNEVNTDAQGIVGLNLRNAIIWLANNRGTGTTPTPQETLVINSVTAS